MTPLKDVVFGQFSLAIGALFYTFWWLSAFKPSGNTGWTSGLSGILFLFLALFGLGGVGLTIYGIHGLPLPSAWPGSGTLSLTALIIYFILLFITSKIFGRIPTTELLLIVCWTLLETLALGVLFEAKSLSLLSFLLSALCIGAATLLSFGSYMIYYKIDEETAYILGAIPLLSDGAVSLFMAVSSV